MHDPNADFDEIWNDDEARAEMLEEQKQVWEELRQRDERFQRHVKTRWEPKDKKDYEADFVVRALANV